MFHLLAETLKAIAAPFLLSFQKQPRILVSRLSCTGTAEHGGAGAESADCVREMTFEMHNQSSFDAFGIEFLFAAAMAQIPPSSPRLHIKAGDKKRLSLRYRVAPATAASPPDDRCVGTFSFNGPHSFELLLRYHNDYHKVFFTRFEKRGDRERNTFHWKQPAISGIRSCHQRRGMVETGHGPKA